MASTAARSAVLGLDGQLLVDLFRGLVDKRARPEHHLHRAPSPSCPHGPSRRPPAQSAFAGTLPDRHPSSPTSRSMSELSSELLQVALHEHLDRLFAEGP